MSHEPLQFLELLRAQLTSPDRRVAFLFGAGSSCAVNIAPPVAAGAKRSYSPLIPAVAGITDLCQQAVAGLGALQATAWDSLGATCTASDRAPHIENILSLLRLTMDANPVNGALGLSSGDLDGMHIQILKTIASVASPAETDIPPDIPHDRFAHWIRGARRKHAVEVFTTNYDVLLERSLELARVPVIDGFVGCHRPYFDPQLVAAPEPGRDSSWVGLWKVHGSVNWETETGQVATVRNASTTSGSMIYPSHRKYDESRRMPYLALMSRFAQVVAIDSTVILTVGYSWHDDHVNACIVEALEQHPANGAIALMYEDLGDVPQLTKLAHRLPNLLVVGPTSAVIGGVEAPWQMTETPTPQKATLVDRWFDSDALEPESPADTPVKGRMKVGDFNVLADLLGGLNTEQHWVA